MSTPEEAFEAWQAAEQMAVTAERSLHEARIAGGNAVWTGQLYTTAYQQWAAAGELYQAYLAAIGQLPAGSLPGG